MTQTCPSPDQDAQTADTRREDVQAQQLTADEFETLYRSWQDSLQDLEDLRDTLLSSLIDAPTPDIVCSIRYALWLNKQALHSAQAMMDLFAPEVKAFNQRLWALFTEGKSQDHQDEITGFR
ncbi:MAG TPA: hypothetical protein VFB12_22035 [Ktedonobacteraceae bacterium]|nr:hypothetical protein [Ktedonobacteraceae bacterium]